MLLSNSGNTGGLQLNTSKQLSIKGRLQSGTFKTGRLA